MIYFMDNLLNAFWGYICLVCADILIQGWIFFFL